MLGRFARRSHGIESCQAREWMHRGAVSALSYVRILSIVPVFSFLLVLYVLAGNLAQGPGREQHLQVHHRTCCLPFRVGSRHSLALRVDQVDGDWQVPRGPISDWRTILLAMVVC